MFITPVKLTNYTNQKHVIGNTQNPIKKQIPFGISFRGHIPNSELLSAGYKPVSIENNRITGKEDKILVDSPQKFLALSNSPDIWGKKITLTNDIDLNGAEIKPIGSNAKPFRGEFDGNGFKISNFKIISEDSYNIGLFGKCENAKLSNLELNNAFIKGKQQVGGLAGYAINSEIKNCFFQGYIEGEKKLGGLIGLSERNLIQNSGSTCNIKPNTQDSYNEFSSSDNAFIVTGSIGGLIGSDENSTLKGVYSHSTLSGAEQVGGLIGYSDKTDIQDSCFRGNIICEDKAGGIIGWASNSNIANSYSLSNKNNPIGSNIGGSSQKSYYKLEDVVSSPASAWSSNIWNLGQGRLPRLKFQEERMSAEEVFLEDVNIDIKTGKINHEYDFDGTVETKVEIDLNPPKHYSENDEMLNKIKKCTDTDSLRQTFGTLVLDMKYMRNRGEDDSKYDELLMALVENPKMDFNTRLTGDDGGYYNVWCTPLFILTCLNKAYVLQQALKRKDVDVTVGSGPSEKRTVLNQAMEHHIDACAYVLLTEPKMDKYIEPKLDELKASNVSKFTRLLLECHPDIPPYDKENGCVVFSKEFGIPEELFEPIKEVLKLEDVQGTLDISSNYRDSRGNNIVNIATNLDDEEEALKIFLAAKKIGTDINNWNNKYESPVGHAIHKKKPHLLAQLMQDTNSPFIRIGDGTDAMLLFSNLPEENYGINYMEIARKRGLSLNSQDNYGTTPLINAIKFRHYDKMRYLLTNGADPNLADSSQQSPLHHACMNNDEIAVNMLLDTFAYPNVKDAIGSTPVEYLEDELKEKTLKKIDEQGYLYLLSGYTEDYESDASIINLDEYSQINSREEFNSISNEILSDNADKTVLRLAKNVLLNPNIKSMRDDEGNSVLHLAASAKSRYAKECIKAALEQGFNINEQNENKETPLIKALDAYLLASDIKEKVILLQNIKMLLDNDSNVDLTDNNKQSALHRVCQSGSLILLNEILRLNPKVNQDDVDGNMPFNYIPKESDDPMRVMVEEYLRKNNVIRGKE